MLNNVYAKIKDFLKNNYKEIIFLILFYIVLTFPLPYYIFAGGGTINLANRFEIKDSYKEKGTYNLSYVSELKGTTLTYLLSYIMPNWERVSVKDYQLTESEDEKDLLKRDKLYLDYGNQTAIRLAYTKAGKDFEIKKTNNYIVYISEKVKSDIQIGDKIIEADGIKINNVNDYKKIVADKNIGDNIKLKLIRDNKEIEREIKVQEIEKEKLTGIGIIELYDYKTNPSIEFNFKDSESGSSAGLMMTLAIYDSLIESDLTSGLKIVGTGTIENDGTVGSIGGVKHKLKGAVDAKADIFLVPSGENYKEVIKIKKEKGYNIKIIEVTSFDDAIEKLKKIKE